MHDFLYFVRWQLYPLARSLPAHLRFVAKGFRSSRSTIGQRLSMAWHCFVVHLRVRCGHNPAEALHIVDAILELPDDVGGVIVECGAYLGASSAKLSRAVSLKRRQLLICDSFEGLPDVTESDHDRRKPDFQKGEYRGRLQVVERNIRRFGRIECVRFVPGWYESSLSELKGTPIALAFWDVDLQASFITCIKALWPEIQTGAKVFLHDIDRGPVVAVFTDQRWWRVEMGIDPPPLVGAFSGLDRSSPLLGYAVRG